LTVSPLLFKSNMSTPKHILVVDVEATCWDNLPPNKFPNTRNEIIEIGLVVMDVKTHEIGERRAIMVKPATTEISDFCTSLTTITPEMIEEYGIPFPDACDILKKEYKSYRQIFASWGDYDRRAFEKNCAWNDVANPFGNMNLNVKALFAAKYGYTGGQAKCGLDLGILMQGTAHRGVDDAYNIAKILQKLLA
jgi:inhibitor of KinA sporulation pathway (predicted exonuclease)